MEHERHKREKAIPITPTKRTYEFFHIHKEALEMADELAKHIDTCVEDLILDISEEKEMKLIVWNFRDPNNGKEISIRYFIWNGIMEGELYD